MAEVVGTDVVDRCQCESGQGSSTGRAPRPRLWSFSRGVRRRCSRCRRCLAVVGVLAGATSPPRPRRRTKVLVVPGPHTADPFAQDHHLLPHTRQGVLSYPDGSSNLYAQRVRHGSRGRVERRQATGGSLVDFKEREWKAKANAVGILPGKAKNQLLYLQQIADALPRRVTDEISLVGSDGEKKSLNVGELCGRTLSRTGFFVRYEEDGLWMFDAALLDVNGQVDSFKTAQRLHENLKFFGELLYEIGDDSRISEVADSAGRYGLLWSGRDQVRKRVLWAKCLGLLEQWTFGGPFVVTERGRAFLSVASLTPPDVAAATPELEATTEKLDAPGGAVGELLASLSGEDLAQRRTLIGYIPKGANARRPGASSGTATASPLRALRDIVDLVGERATLDDFARDCLEYFNLKKASFEQTLHTVRNLALIEPVAYNEVAPTDLAQDILAEDGELDFARFLHCKFAFIGELLNELDGATVAADLTQVARRDYGLHQMKNQEIRTRMGFLLDAGLVERIDWKRYRLTATGQALLNELPLASRMTATGADQVGNSEVAEPLQDLDKPSPPAPSIEVLLEKLSNLSTGPEDKEFELALSEVFRFLGFHVMHVGGNSATDVIAVAHLGAGHSYKVTVEAKTSRSGVISESQVLFQALKLHREAVKADASIIVAPGFPKRLRQWALADENGFGTLTVDELSSVLRLHSELPLTIQQLRSLFQPGEGVARKVIEEYESDRLARVVLSSIVASLHVEASDDDPIGDGSITRSQLSFSLRRELRPRPDPATIDAALDLLTSPLIRAAEMLPERNDREPRDGDKFRMSDSPKNIRERLGRLGVEIEEPA